jgi:hypothetical protein
MALSRAVMGLLLLYKEGCKTIICVFVGFSRILLLDILIFKGLTNKGKTIPVQPWAGPEGYKRLRFPDFKPFGT